MSITLTFKTDSPIPHNLFRQCVSVRVEGNNAYLYELERYSEWETVLALLEQQEIRVHAQSVILTEVEPYRWDQPDPDWVAAVLGPHCILRASNPIEDYDPPLPSPCQGVIRDRSPISLQQLPFGHVASVGHTLLFSAQMADLLIRSGGASVGHRELLVRSEPIGHWQSLCFHATCRVIDPEVVHSAVRCALCGTNYSPVIGMWLSGTEIQVDAECAIDQLGYGHSRLAHPVVVSLELSRAIDKVFRGKGYVLEPVYRPDSQRGHLISQVLRKFH